MTTFDRITDESMDGLKRIYARNCEVRKITREVAEPFLEASHALGFTRCKHFYGLYRKRSTGASEPDCEEVPDGSLVAVAGFSGPRTWIKDGKEIRSFEWVRYASLKGYGIDGGMGKVLKAFIDEVRPDDVMSYADASGPDKGEVYRTLGFTEESRKAFPNGGESLKFRLKLTDW